MKLVEIFCGIILSGERKVLGGKPLPMPNGLPYIPHTHWPGIELRRPMQDARGQLLNHDQVFYI